MGVEPTGATSRTHAGFEDQAQHRPGLASSASVLKVALQILLSLPVLSSAKSLRKSGD